MDASSTGVFADVPPDKRLWFALGAAFVLAVGLGIGWLATSAGGPDATASGPQRAQVADWVLLSSSSDGDAGGMLCRMGDPCRVSKQRAASQRGDVCALEASVTLTSRLNPVLVRDVHGEVETRAHGRTADREPATRTSTRELAWENGAWWRFETETVEVVAPTPCMVDEVSIASTVRGVTLSGDAYGLTQSVVVEPLGSPVAS